MKGNSNAENIEHWKEMPEFIQEKQEPFKKLTVRFNSQEDVDNFATLIGQKINEKTKSIWYPALVRGINTGKRYIDAE